MDKVLEFFKNKWVKRAVSLLSLGFPAFLAYVDWLAFAYSLEPVNPVPLFLLYVLVNFVFGGIMFYTRKQIVTRLSVCLSPLIAFVMVIVAFGQWYLLIPPLAVCVFVFLASGAGETLKTVFGTIYLLMFVVGSLAYMTLLHFNLTPQKLLPDEWIPGGYCDLTNRSPEYVYSQNGSYRLVRYVDQKDSERVSVRYYVEDAGEDVHLWYLDCYRHLSSLCVLTTVRSDEIEYRWVSDTELYIDGRVKNIPELLEKQNNPADENAEGADNESETKTSSVKKQIVFDTGEPEETQEPDGSADTEANESEPGESSAQ